MEHSLVKPSQMAKILKQLMLSKGKRQPALILGPPGIGKTSLGLQAASAVYGGAVSHETTVGGMAQHSWFVPISATDKDPTDITGLPYVVGDCMKRSKSDYLDMLGPEGGVLCIEEFPQATATMQCALRPLLLDRTIGGHKLPDNWYVMATGNRVEDRAGAGRLLTHVSSAVVNLTLTYDADDWQAWALEADVHPHVRNWLRMSPNEAHQFDPSVAVNADPRGWERVASVLDAVDDDLLMPVVSGCVGEASAIKFLAWRRKYALMVDPDEVINNASSIPVPSDVSVLYALVGALSSRCKGATNSVITAVATFASRLRGDFAVLLVQDSIAASKGNDRDCRMSTNPVTLKWCDDNKDVILAASKSL